MQRMPSKKKKYNARFPAGRIKKIMQSDEEIGKVAQAVPVIISRTLELFVESLLTKTLKITNSRNAKTLSTSHMKQCIMSEQRFDFLRELVKNIPDISVAEEAANYNEEDGQSSPEENYPDSDTPYDLSMPSTSTHATRNAANVMNGAERGSEVLNSHNENGSSNNAQLKSGLADIKMRLRQHIGSSGANTYSVIMHTAAVSTDNPPSKLMRSDSTPVNATQRSWALKAHQQQPLPQATQRHQRLKHQSQSMPSAYGGVANTSSNNSYNNNTIPDCLPPKRQKLDHQQSQTAIPAPIVSFDFCNKPIVKIDYSNLPLPPTSPPVAPHSAPTFSQTKSSGFDFSTEPIINIDLSNIVTTGAANTVATAATTTPSVPAVATISIGAIPSKMPPATITAGIQSATFPCSFSPTTSSMPSDSKAMPAAAASATITLATPVVGPTAASSKNSFFELDEDYDDI